MYPIGPVSGRTLFQMHFEQLRALAQRLGRGIPLYLMTSPATHNETVAFLDRHARFGLPAEDVRVFCQGTMPAMDERGKVLLSAKGELFLSPDGHGGMLAAWQQSGCLQDAIDRGLSQIFYFQVDNPLVRVADCELLGFHVLQGAEMSTQVIAKQDPMEKVGNVVQVDGRLMVIEYSDLPPEAARERNADGSLKFWAGSIAVHGFTVDFLRRSAALGDSLPWHRAKKKVPYVDATGRLVEPVEPNATKFERFIFDLMPHAARAVVVEADAAEVFAPVKNAPGEAKDTPETAQAAIIERARRWLAAAGVRPREGIAVEISPFVALNAQELAQRVRGSLCLNSDTYLTEAIICQRNVSNSGPELEK